MTESSKDIKRWENGLNKWDLYEESRKNNKFLEMFGRDQYTFEPQTLMLRNLYLDRNEAPLSHGYPYTSWLQLSIVYACGVYTA